jgi:hypothetical protein
MIIYTNAPEDFDYHYVTELDPDVGRFTSGMDTDKPVRKLEINAPDWQIQHQRDRYSSGLYPSLTQEQFDEWLECEFVIPAMPGDENSEDGHVEMTPPPADAYCAHCSVAARLDELGTTCRSCGRGTVIASTTTDAEEEEGEG